MTPTTYHLTTQQQVNSAIIAALVCVAIGYGFVTLWRDWRRGWEIDDLTDWLLMDRDQHLGAERAAMRARRGR